MDGYVAQRRGRFYAVIYEGRDPVTGKEQRRWHPAGTDRAEAERLATRLAAEETKRTDAVRSLTFGAYLTSQWLPAKKLHLATSTYRGYERNVKLHVLPVLGRISIRRLRYQQIRVALRLLAPTDRGSGARPQDRVRDPPAHPRRAHRRPPPRPRHPQRRARRPGTEAAIPPEDRGQVVDRRPAPSAPAGRPRTLIAGWPWADPLAALMLAGLAIKEGRETWEGDACC